MHKEIVLPSRFDGSVPAWTQDRSTIWNLAEAAEGRKNSRVGREYMVRLPHELSAPQRLALTRSLSRLVADRHNVLVDVAIHAPRPDGDPRNYHAHLLVTTREVTQTGLGPKSAMEWSDTRRRLFGLSRSTVEIGFLRERWADLTNEAFRAAHLGVRVDPRSLEAQGVDREPFPNIPIGMIHAERRGQRSPEAERIRMRFRQRAAVRAAQPAQAEREMRGSGSLRVAMDLLKEKSLQAWSLVRSGWSAQPVVEPRRLLESPPRIQAAELTEADDAEVQQRTARAWLLFNVMQKAQDAAQEREAADLRTPEHGATWDRARERDNDYAL